MLGRFLRLVLQQAECLDDAVSMVSLLVFQWFQLTGMHHAMVNADETLHDHDS